jgi:adenylylsulfate kinase-like enzyme
VTAAISPYQSVRDEVRGWIDHFVEIHVATSLEDCEARDVKGLYAKARAGAIPEFTGVSDPYEPPEHPELRIETAGKTPEASAAEVIAWLEGAGLSPPAAN